MQFHVAGIVDLRLRSWSLFVIVMNRSHVDVAEKMGRAPWFQIGALPFGGPCSARIEWEQRSKELDESFAKLWPLTQILRTARGPACTRGNATLNYGCTDCSEGVISGARILCHIYRVSVAVFGGIRGD